MTPGSMLLEPAVLFFVLGLLVALVGSNLEVPPAVAKFFSLYLLMAVGLKGGQALAETGLSGAVLKVVAAAMALAVVVPAYSFLLLRRRLDAFDAAAIAATYGSVSAVTFTVALEFVLRRGEAVSGGATVALVLMESPAIVMAVLLASWVRSQGRGKRAGAGDQADPGMSRAISSTLDAVVPEADEPTGTDARPAAPLDLREVLREAFTDGAHLLLVGSLLIGYLSGAQGAAAMKPFAGDLFKGMLAFFLLEMGLLVGRRLHEVREVGPFLLAFGFLAPPANALLAIGLARLLDLAMGDAVLLAVLGASASYIVVPAVIRYAIPEARPSRYFSLALGITFPFNVLVGIPLYHALVLRLWG